VTSPYLGFGLPPDAVSVAALVAAALLLVARKTPLAERVQRLDDRLVVGALALVAALLSAGYVACYLRGGPRIIDATSYYLEARALSQGKLAFDVPWPTGSFRGRFLVPASSEGHPLAVLFPPGYPALLALGFLARAPLAVGPLLAAALVWATYFLARELTGRRDVARLAAALSVVCAALRYHTADTMSHGLAALLVCVGFIGARRGGLALGLSGLALGWLFATRPLTAFATLPLCFAIALRHRARALFILPALVPGVALLVAHQHAATGSFWESSQLRYYSLADGPPGCFRLGFGEGIGCLFEHGDFVRKNLASGRGPLEALLVTARRLRVHAIDVANFELLALLVPIAALRLRRQPGVPALGLGVLSVVLAYALFYFDGSYPGGGARFYADVLPLEHVLLALAALELRVARYLVPSALAGFALHGVFGHAALRDREGGRPMFEPRVLAEAGVRRGLVFVETDHGFSLGHDPGVSDPWQRPLVARRRGDARDVLLWERFGRPPAYLYRFEPGSPASLGTVAPYPLKDLSSLRFEAEAEWPALVVSGGFAHPDHHPNPCVSGGRGLRLVRTGDRPVVVELEIAAREPGWHELEIQWLADPPTELQVGLASQEEPQKALAPRLDSPCSAQALGPIRVDGRTNLRVVSSARSLLVDYIELHPAQAKMR
jgi:hypothetical protein